MDHIDRFLKESNANIFYKTHGYKALCNFIEDFIRKEKFVEFVARIRKKYDINENGFDHGESPHFRLPKDWKHRKDISKIEALREEIAKFCEPYKLPMKDWLFEIEQYIFYNKLLVSTDPNSHNLCYVTDIMDKKDLEGQELNQGLINSYPIGLLISPYTSKRSILNYVEKIFKTEIEPLQKKYTKDRPAFAIGDSKTKKAGAQKRDDHVYKNKELHLNEIMASFETSKEVIDPGYIATIRSREIKKRKKVARPPFLRHFL